MTVAFALALTCWICLFGAALLNRNYSAEAPGHVYHRAFVALYVIAFVTAVASVAMILAPVLPA